MKRPPPRDDAAAAGSSGGGGGGGFKKGKGSWGGKKRNEQRLGGSGGALSLAAFANAKSRNTGYNPALISEYLLSSFLDTGAERDFTTACLASNPKQKPVPVSVYVKLYPLSY
jgi:hypothetical protein